MSDAPEESPVLEIPYHAIRVTRVRTFVSSIGRIVFGDQKGITVFLVAVILFAATWRVGPFINDNYTIANALVAVRDGHLHLEQTVYGPSGPETSTVTATPGTHILDGRVYGRNYGQVFLALPFLLLITAGAAVLDPVVWLSVLWTGLSFALFAQIGSTVVRRREALLVGAPLALLVLISNLIMSEPIPPRLYPWMALQFSTMIVAALVAVVIYRLVARMHDRLIGAAAGTVAAVGTPVGFWATIPKRHSLTALFAVATLYCFYRSRSAPTLRESTRFRALSYVPVALAAWVHAPEGFMLFLALGTVDIATARSNDPRHLAFIAAVFGVALVPFMVTNTVVAGIPLEPPRTWPTYQGTVDPGAAGPGSNGAASRGNGGVGMVASAAILLETISGFGVRFVTRMTDSIRLILDAERLFDTFVRSGNELGIGQAIIGGGPSLNISVLESMPLAAVLLVTPLVAVTRLQASSRSYADAVATVKRDPRRAADLLAVGYLSLLILMYLPSLPIHVSFTVRYLHPLYPLAVYFLTRLALVRRVIDAEWRLLGVSYVGFVLLGGPLLIGSHAVLAGELEVAVQYHARLALAAGAVVLYWSVASVGFNERYARGGAVALALAAAVATLYVLFSAWLYFPYTDQFALPISRQIAEFLIRRVADWRVSL